MRPLGLVVFMLAALSASLVSAQTFCVDGKCYRETIPSRIVNAFAPVRVDPVMTFTIPVSYSEPVAIQEVMSYTVPTATVIEQRPIRSVITRVFQVRPFRFLARLLPCRRR